MKENEHYDTEGKYCPLVQCFKPPCELCMWAIANGECVVCSVAVQAFGGGFDNAYMNCGVRTDE